MNKVDIYQKTQSMLIDLANVKHDPHSIKNLEGGLVGLCRRAEWVVKALSEQRFLVTGTIMSGLFEIESLPSRVDLEVRDYDIQGICEDELLEDDDGTYYFIAG